MPSLLISQNEQKNPPWPHVHFVSNADETVFCISNLIRTLELSLQHSDRRKCIPCVVAWSLNLHLQRIARPALRVVGGRLAKVGERYCSTVQRVVSDFLRWGSHQAFRRPLFLSFKRNILFWLSKLFSIYLVLIPTIIPYFLFNHLQLSSPFFFSSLLLFFSFYFFSFCPFTIV